jgi:uncharacterized protein (TIGR02444 family)
MAIEPLADNSFWDFSLALYASEAVAQQCLALQDDWDADVNLLLYGIWLAHHGIGWSDDAVKTLQAEFDPWRKITIVPLRTVRRRLRFQTKRRYYNFLKDLELRAERRQQDRLWLHWLADYCPDPRAHKSTDTLPSCPRPVAADAFQQVLQANLQLYLQRLEMRPRSQAMHPKVDDQLDSLIAAVVAQRASTSLSQL